ncbi:MAG TPA: hypothetical protein VF590_23655, partial [Isosphaeraceae bacterium]
MTIRPDRRRHPATRAGRVAPLIFAALGGGCTTLPMPPRLSHTASSARVDPAPGSVARRTSSGASAVHPTTRVQVVPSFGAYAPRQLPGHEPGPRPSTIASAPAPGPAPRPVPSSGPSVPMPTSLTTSTLPGGFSLPDAPAPGSGPDRDPEVSTTSPAGRGLIAPSPDPTEERLPEEAGAGREEPTAGDADRRAEPTIEAVPQVPEVIIPPGVVPVPVPSDPVPVPESPAILPEDLPSTPATPMAQEPERAPADSVPPAASDVANSDHAAGGDWG